MPDCEDINECLKASFSPVKLEEVPLTKPPMAVTELVEKQLL